MNLKKNPFNKNSYLIAYKLLHDALFLALVSFAVLLIAEGLLPGFVSSHISLARVAVAIILILGLIAWLGNKFQITYDAPRIKKNKLLPILIMISFLLIGNSMLKFTLWVNIATTLMILLAFFMIYEMIFYQKK